MTNEEKLRKLLKIAESYGWKPNHIHLIFIIYGGDFSIRPNLNIVPEINGGIFNTYSFNDLVYNFEPDEVSFIDALCKASKLDDIPSSHPQFYRTICNELPTSQRLEKLFEIFNHLIIASE